MILQGQHTALELFQTIAERLTSKLKTQIKTFFLPLLLGALFALARRRTVGGTFCVERCWRRIFMMLYGEQD